MSKIQIIAPLRSGVAITDDKGGPLPAFIHAFNSLFPNTQVTFSAASTALTTAQAAQPGDNDLTALAGLTGTGIAVRTATDTWNTRTLTAPAAGLSITNPAGIAGNPTFALSNDLAALEALSGTHTIYYRSATDTWSAVTIGTGLSFVGATLSCTVSGGTGTVTTTGSPASGNLAKFSGATSIVNGDLSGDVTTSGTLATTIANNAVTTAKINNSAVTLAKIANAAANSKLIGSGASGSGAAYAELALGTNLSMSGTTLNAATSSGVGATWTALTPVSPSAVSTVTFTGLSSYNELLIIARALTATVSGVRRIQVSTNGGASYDSTAANYINVADTGVEANAATPGIAFHTSNNTAARTLIAHIKNLKGPTKACHFNNAIGACHIHYVGSASDIDAIQIDNHTGGTISGGPIQVYAR